MILRFLLNEKNLKEDLNIKMPIECWNRSYKYFKLRKLYQQTTGGMDSSIPFPGFPNKEYIDSVNSMQDKLNLEREYIQKTCPKMFEFMNKIY